MSRITVFSTLLANPDESIYTESAFRENRGEGMMWISGKDLKQISITGTGEIDGNGIAFMGKELDDSYELKPVTDFDPRHGFRGMRFLYRCFHRGWPAIGSWVPDEGSHRISNIADRIERCVRQE